MNEKQEIRDGIQYTPTELLIYLKSPECEIQFGRVGINVQPSFKEE